MERELWVSFHIIMHVRVCAYVCVGVLACASMCGGQRLTRGCPERSLTEPGDCHLR